MKTYYAESQCENNKDLWRFNSKQKRDDFVNESADNNQISSKEAKQKHKEQFNYWKFIEETEKVEQNEQ